MTTTVTRSDPVKPTETERVAVDTGAIAPRRTGRPTPAKPKRSLVRGVKLRVAVIMRRPSVQHLMRAAKRFSERLGSQFAGAITYFSFLALLPILMVAFSAAGYVLASRPDLLAQLESEITKQFPSSGAGMGDLISKLLASAVGARAAVGIVGLVTALYSAIGWMGNLRAAIQAQWRPDFDENQEIASSSFIKNLWKNLWMFATLGVALVISLSLSAVASNLTTSILGWLGLSDIAILKPIFAIIPIVLAIGADVLIFAWVYTVIPQKGMKATRKALLRGALMAAVAFEVLKFLLTFFLPKVTSSASGLIFGPIIGLLFFFNLVATVVLFVAAWIATSPGGFGDRSRDKKEPDGVPEPAVILPESLSRKRAIGYVGVGAILGLGAASRAGRLRRRR